MGYILLGIFILGVTGWIIMSKYFPLPDFNRAGDDFDAFYLPAQSEIQKEYKAGKVKDIWQRFCAENTSYEGPNKDEYEDFFQKYLEARKDLMFSPDGKLIKDHATVN